MLGLLVEFFPSVMGDQYSPITDLALTTLEAQLKSAKPEQLVIAGALDCLTSLLTQCDEAAFPGGE